MVLGFQACNRCLCVRLYQHWRKALLKISHCLSYTHVFLYNLVKVKLTGSRIAFTCLLNISFYHVDADLPRNGCSVLARERSTGFASKVGMDQTVVF